MDRPKPSLFSSENAAPTRVVVVEPVPLEEPSHKTGYLAFTFVLLLIGVVFVVLTFGKKGDFSLMSLLSSSSSSSSSIATEMTVEQKGNDVFVRMKTSDAYADQLCDIVMEDIYLLAAKYSSAQALHMTVQIGPSEAVIDVKDLDVVRQYPNKKTYVSSEHRPFVGAPLVAAGFITELSLTTVGAADATNGLVGNMYQIGPEVSPRTGLKFLDDSRVDVLSDGAKVGDTCQYTVEGDIVTVPTSCTTFHYRIAGNNLVEVDMHFSLTKQ